MTFQSILALTDFSTSAEHALDRAALLAVRHRSNLRIMYADEIPSLGFSDPFARLQQRARQMARRHGIAAEALAHGGDMLDAIVRYAARADLLVLDHRQHRQWHTFWRGTTLDQLIRRCPCPVLVVRQASSGPYSHILVAQDATSESRGLVRYASISASEPEFELLNVWNTLNETAIHSDTVSAEAPEACRKTMRQDARSRSIRFPVAFDKRRNRASWAAMRAEPVSPIPMHPDSVRSSLVIVGKRRNSTLVDFLFGSVARSVVSLAGCDVLVICHDYKGPSGAAAKSRMQALLNNDVGQFQLVRKESV